MSTTSRLPLVLVRSTVVFPRAVATLHLSRGENLAAMARAGGLGSLLVAVPMVEPEAEPSVARLSRTACLCRLLDRVPLEDGAERVILEGLRRVRLVGPTARGEGFEARVRELEVTCPDGADTDELSALVREVLELVRHLSGRDPRTSAEIARQLERVLGEPGRFADLAAARLHLSYADQSALLAAVEPQARLAHLRSVLQRELSRHDLASGLRDKVQERLRREFLHEQLAVIQNELGGDPLESEAQAFEAQVARLKLPAHARAGVRREIAHLRRTAPGSPEAARLRTWIEWVLELPWRAREPKHIRKEAFERVALELGCSHTALSDVKQRVIEYLAVRRLRGAKRGTVLCFVGPPGTGKTSMARAVAKALGRAFVHIPLGGVTRENQLVGSPRTQPDAMPGRILQGLQRARAADAVLLLDEIDKVVLGSEGTGGVLLEVLDSEQNQGFLDHYLGLPFDLSGCVFLATANDLSRMPEALVDRLEVIRFGSYTEGEKLAIARRHLIERAREAAGLTPHQLRISPSALSAIVRGYSEEAGVRQLSRALDSLARKAALRVAQGFAGLEVKKSALLELLGPAIADQELHIQRPRIGVTWGLAWTAAGGSMLPIEALAMPGSGRVTLTGSVGDVMRESVQAALSWARSHFGELGVDEAALDKLDLHVHFPSGATPKDGPSAGIAIATSLVSLLTGVRVRHDVAMTGELTLHGEVLPVGGLRDKLLAAVRAGVREAIVPSRNSEEVLRLPAEVRQHLRIHLVERADEVLARALYFGARSRVRTALVALRRSRRAEAAPGSGSRTRGRRSS